MVSSESWLRILVETAQEIVVKVNEARLQGIGLELRDYKHLLDEVAQTTLISALTKKDISVNLISEEGNVTLGEGGNVLIADPVDGTTNLSRGLPPAVTCLAVSENNRLSGMIAAVVVDIYSGEIYSAERGKGAFLYEKRITPSTPRIVKSALLSLDVSKNTRLDRMMPLLNQARYIRMLGASASELCYVASGILDAHIDVRGTVRVTDVAAGLFIIGEAGGVYSVNGQLNGDLPLTKEATLELVAASSKSLLDEILSLTKV